MKALLNNQKMSFVAFGGLMIICCVAAIYPTVNPTNETPFDGVMTGNNSHRTPWRASALQMSVRRSIRPSSPVRPPQHCCWLRSSSCTRWSGSARCSSSPVPAYPPRSSPADTVPRRVSPAVWIHPPLIPSNRISKRTAMVP